MGMSQNAGVVKQSSSFKDHIVRLAAAVAVAVMLYWLAGGFPPAIWQDFGRAVSQLPSLWTGKGPLVLFPLLLLLVQAILLLLAWMLCLWVVFSELYGLIAAPSPAPGAGAASAASTSANKQPPPIRVTPVAPAPMAASPTTTPLAASPPIAPPEPAPVRGNPVSNTMSPATPLSTQWILRTQGPLVEDAIAASVTIPLQVFADTHPAASPEDTLHNPFEQDALSKAETLPNPFDDDTHSKVETLLNPFEGADTAPEEVVLDNPFQEDTSVVDEIPAVPPEIEDDTLPDASRAATSAPEPPAHPEAVYLLGNPFEGEMLPDILQNSADGTASSTTTLPQTPDGIYVLGDPFKGTALPEIVQNSEAGEAAESTSIEEEKTQPVFAALAEAPQHTGQSVPAKLAATAGASPIALSVFDAFHEDGPTQPEVSPARAPVPPSHPAPASREALSTLTTVPFPVKFNTTEALAVGVSTHTGIARAQKLNEDSYLVLNKLRTPPNGLPQHSGLFLVADGMGGHNDGGFASALVIEHIRARLEPRLLDGSAGGEELKALLLEAIHYANEQLFRRNESDKIFRGTTLTGALVLGEASSSTEGATHIAHIVNVGDSRTYHYTASQGLVRITRDHSTVEDLIARRMIMPEERYTHRQRNEILRCMGEHATVEVDVFSLALRPHDRLLLCSDGLWEMVRDPALASLMAIHLDDAQQIAMLLQQAALEGGGADNVTALVVLIPD